MSSPAYGKPFYPLYAGDDITPPEVFLLQFLATQISADLKPSSP